MGEPLLAAAHLTKRFGGILAAHDVSLTVAPGEIRGLIGPNGAGKTTLVNLVTGIYPPTSGEIRFRGENLVGFGPHEIARRGLLRTFQVCRIFGNLSVEENLLVAHLARGRRAFAEAPTRTVRAGEMLEVTGLAKLADLPAKALSGGQRALLQVACGFMVPELTCYVLDEPFAGINPVIKDAIIDLILRANQERGVTFLIVSHEMTVMRRLCHSVSVLMDGRVVSEGTLDEVAAHPQVIAAYLGKAWT
jgi:ABC-type branched-subunit amino acid transport system ATPase component